MIGVFDNANIPINPRKYRRLKEKPPDEGNPSDKPDKTTMNFDDGIPLPPSIPSYRDSLLHGPDALSHDESNNFDDEDIELLEGDVTRSIVDGLITVDFSERETCPDINVEPGEKDTNQQPNMTHTKLPQPTIIDKSPFGPWMVVEKRQRRTLRKPSDRIEQQPNGIFTASRFNPIYDLEGDKNEEPMLPKNPKQTKAATTIHIRKPLSLAEFPILVRNNGRASSFKMSPSKNAVLNLDKAKHSAMIIEEDSNPITILPRGNITVGTNPQNHPLGDPPNHLHDVETVPVNPPNIANALIIEPRVDSDDISHEPRGNQVMAMLE
ncbi:hypothetical protein V6N13_038357 [Hibiscus sabdariffa]